MLTIFFAGMFAGAIATLWVAWMDIAWTDWRKRRKPQQVDDGVQRATYQP